MLHEFNVTSIPGVIIFLKHSKVHHGDFIDGIHKTFLGEAPQTTHTSATRGL